MNPAYCPLPSLISKRHHKIYKNSYAYLNAILLFKSIVLYIENLEVCIEEFKYII